MPVFQKVLLVLLASCALCLPGQATDETQPLLRSTLEFRLDTLKLIETKTHSKVKKIDSLGGLTNKNYLFSLEDGTSYVIKIYNPGLRDPVARRAEKNHQIWASQLDLAPKIDSINEEIAIIDYIPSAKDLEVNEKTLSECAKLFARLHYSHLEFEGRFNLAKILDDYTTVCRKEGTLSAEDEKFITEVVDRFQALCKSFPEALNVPCHNDLHPSNILVGKDGLRLIDWEASSMNDPAWDICYFLIASFVPDNLWPSFMETYTALMPKKDVHFAKRVKLYRPFVLLKIGLFLKSYGRKDQELERVDNLIRLCMEGAKEIFNDKSYQVFLKSAIDNKP